ncbi:MAG: ferritin-like domain-containing protein [Bryobacteraceae bacterium]
MPGTLQDYAQAVHDVISINRDAEQGFRGAAHAVNDPEIKLMFEQYAAERAQFATELQAAVRTLGFDPIDPQGVGGMVRASWMSLKGILTGHDVHAILVETERAEDSSLKTYRIALSKTLTPEIALIMQRQFGQVQAAHDRIQALSKSTARPEDEPAKGPGAAPSVPPKDDVPASI